MSEQAENIIGMRKKIKAQAEHVRRLEKRIGELRQEAVKFATTRPAQPEQEPFWYAVVSEQAPSINSAIRRLDVAQEFADSKRERWPDTRVVPLYAAPIAQTAPQGLRIVFDGPPGPEAGRFVEAENAEGSSVNAGEWRQRTDGLWELVLHETAPQPEQSGLVEAASGALAAIQDAMEDAYHNAYPECCGQAHLECCGSPLQAWSEADQKTMERFAPHEKALRAALSAQGTNP